MDSKRIIPLKLRNTRLVTAMISLAIVIILFVPSLISSEGELFRKILFILILSTAFLSFFLVSLRWIDPAQDESLPEVTGADHE